MSTIRRLFDDPRNTERRGDRYVQVCCDGNPPYWDTYRVRNDTDAWASRDDERNMPQYRHSDSVLVRDMTGASDRDVEVLERDINGKMTGSNDKWPGYVRVEGPSSGYRPDFLSVKDWMAWQGVEMTSPLVEPMQWVARPWLRHMPHAKRTRIRDDKMRWGKGPGGWAAYGHTFLWCQKCETALESAWSDTLDALPMIARGVAMVVSNIPVFGTAIAFVIGAAVAIAQDQPLDEAMLGAIGGALPGQPTSGMAFNAGVAIAQGKRIDEVAIASLPIPPEMKRVVQVAANVVYGMASGQHVTKVAYDEIRKQLPPSAQKAMDVAKRIANGENVPGMILEEAEKIALHQAQQHAQSYIDGARAKGEAALGVARAQADAVLNSYAAQTGYQIALMALPTWERDAIQTGLAAGAMTTVKSAAPMFASAPEKPQAKATLDTYYAKGLAISQSALSKFKGRTLSDLLTNGGFIVPIKGAMNGVSLKWDPTVVVQTNVTKALLTPEFKRGFLIATGLCDGMAEDGPGQNAIYQSVAEKSRGGFDAGQAVAHYRTKYDIQIRESMVSTKVNSAHSAILSAFGPALPASTATVKAGLPSLSALAPPVTVIAQPRTTPLVIDPRVYAQKNSDRARWVDYYKNL